MLRQPPTRLLLWAVLLLVVVAPSGCAQQYLKLRKVPQNPLTNSLQLVSFHGPQPSERTNLVLRRYDLAGTWKTDAPAVINRLQKEVAREYDPERIYSLAELSYIEAHKLEKEGQVADALDYYSTSVAQAYQFLLDRRLDSGRNPYDPEFRGACDLYNGALEAAMRIANKGGNLKPGHTTIIRSGKHEFHVAVNVRGPWRADEIDHLEFTNDYEIEGGFSNRHHTYGLGVPLIAVRSTTASRGTQEKYYPPSLSFPLTAFLRVVDQRAKPSGGDAFINSCVLELYDPHYSCDVQLCNRVVPLETELTIPLAHLLDSPYFKKTDFATDGLFDPDGIPQAKGLFMLEPYDPNRIPVVMVHGLWSSPTTWMEMFNDLRSWREIREKYQFWFYLYPTAQPFWTSAADLRQTLAEARRTLDPHGKNIYMNEMVLVGHSMGGLLARLQTIESGDNFWHILSDQPFSNLVADEADRAEIAKCVYFKPNPGVKRVITLGTPHHGSTSSNSYTQYLGQKFIHLPEIMVQLNNRVVRDNPGVFKNTKLLTTTTSIDSLSPNSPVFPVLNEAAPAPWVRNHNVLGVWHSGNYLERFSSEVGDGVVSRESAQWPQAETEVEIDADHTSVHRHPRAILEVREILRQHDLEVRQAWARAGRIAWEDVQRNRNAPVHFCGDGDQVIRMSEPPSVSSRR
jgi:hypothetical protein